MKKYKVEKEEYFKDSSLLLFENKSEKIDYLFEVYKKNRFHARVIYMNDTSNYSHQNLWLFNKKNGDFSIVMFKKTTIPITKPFQPTNKKFICLNTLFPNKA